MWYSILLTGNTFNEYSLFLDKYKHLEELELSLETFSSIDGIAKWDRVLYIYKKGLYRHFPTVVLSKIFLGGAYIVVNKGFLGVLEDNKVRILINETDHNVYIDKYFERDFKKIFFRFKEILLSLYTTSKDIIYTDNPGKCCFYQYEKPKFKSISERKGYVNSLLDTLSE